jgi:hypothetical protein
MVGLATLARNDGVLLGAAVGLAFVWDRWRAWRSKGGRLPAIPWRYAFACFGLFLLVMAPWYLRQLAVFGSLSPSSTSGRILLIQTYEQMDSVTTDTSLAGFLSQGIGPLLQSRVLGFVSAFQIYFVIACPIVLAPFVAIGGLGPAALVDFGPFFTYAAILFAASACSSPSTFRTAPSCIRPWPWCRSRSSWPSRAPFWHRDGPPDTGRPGPRRAPLASSSWPRAVRRGQRRAFTFLALPAWNADRDNRSPREHALDAKPARPPDRPPAERRPGRVRVLHRPRGGRHAERLARGHPPGRGRLQHPLAGPGAGPHRQIPLVPVIESKVRPAWIGADLHVPYTGPKTGDAAVDARRRWPSTRSAPEPATCDARRRQLWPGRAP